MTAASLPPVTVVIPSYRSSTTLAACLDAACGQEYDGEFSVLVVHSGPEPVAERARASHPTVDWHVVSERWLPGQARNWALQTVSTEFVAFLDSDCIARHDWLQSLLREMGANSFDGAGGAVVTHLTPTRSWAMHLLEFGEWLPWGKSRMCRDFCTSGAAYRRRTIEGVEFPEAFYPCEETVVNHMLLTKGATLGFVPSAVVHHIHRRTSKQVLQYCVTSGATYRKSVEEYGLRGRAILRTGSLVGFVLAAGVRTLRPLRDGFRLGASAGVRTLLAFPLILAGGCAWAFGFVRGTDAIAASSLPAVAPATPS